MCVSAQPCMAFGEDICTIPDKSYFKFERTILSLEDSLTANSQMQQLVLMRLITHGSSLQMYFICFMNLSESLTYRITSERDFVTHNIKHRYLGYLQALQYEVPHPSPHLELVTVSAVNMREARKCIQAVSLNLHDFWLSAGKSVLSIAPKWELESCPQIHPVCKKSPSLICQVKHTCVCVVFKCQSVEFHYTSLRQNSTPTSLTAQVIKEKKLLFFQLELIFPTQNLFMYIQF